MRVTIFIAYSHKNKRYLRDDSLLGHLRGLEQEGVADFWDDEEIATGDHWDDEIKARIASSQIALVLVSELFLNSPYITNTEIPLFLQRRREEGMIVFPVILSACDWKKHEWLSETQFLPTDGKNIESHYSKPGGKQEIFLRIKRDLRSQIDRILEKAPASAIPTPSENLGSERSTQIQTSRSRDWENPFDLVTANDLRFEDIPQLFVGDYIKDISTIQKHFDTIVEGQRGTGKTMVLRYMAFETQIKIWTDKLRRAAVEFFKDRGNFIGVYCRLEQGVFDRGDLDAVANMDRKDQLFENRIVLFCLSYLLKTLGAILECRPASPEVFLALKQRLSVLLEESQITECLHWRQLYNYAQHTINLRVATEDMHLSSILPGSTPTNFNPWLTLSGQFLPFLEFLQESLEIVCPFFLLLDDFDVLRRSQQFSVFRTASARKHGVVCFKYGLMTLGKKGILSGTERTYREGGDYELAKLDWTDNGVQTDYKKAVEVMTAKRLTAKQWPSDVSIRSLLAVWKHGEKLRSEVKLTMQSEWEKLSVTKKPKTFENYWSKYGNAKYFQFLAQKRIHHRYAGYDTVIDISSGIYMQYIQTCSRIVGNALASGWTPDSGKQIAALIQDEAIREYSRDMMDSLSVTAGDTSALLSGRINITSKHMVTFIESLSELFKKRLHSNIREPEIFSIAIRDEIDKDPMAKAILDVAVRESILHRRSADYTPKTGGGHSLPTYMLNRRLAPRWGLGVRMQGRIEVLSADITLAAEDTKKFIKKYLKKDREVEDTEYFQW